jgi:hypothetical protein
MGGSTQKRPRPAAGPLRSVCGAAPGAGSIPRVRPSPSGSRSVSRLFLGLFVLWCCFGCVAATGAAEQLIMRNPAKLAAAVAAVTTVGLTMAQCCTPTTAAFHDCPTSGTLPWSCSNSRGLSGEIPSQDLNFSIDVVQPALQSVRKKKKGGFRGTANWELLPSAESSAVVPSSNEDLDLADGAKPTAPAIDAKQNKYWLGKVVRARGLKEVAPVLQQDCECPISGELFSAGERVCYVEYYDRLGGARNKLSFELKEALGVFMVPVLMLRQIVSMYDLREKNPKELRNTSSRETRH